MSKAEQAAAVLAGAFLFNLGQGVLRPTMPLYLQHIFAANYQMVTLIPVAFGLGKWMASLPTGYLLDRLGRRRLMAGGLILIALADLGSAMTTAYGVFLSFARWAAWAGPHSARLRPPRWWTRPPVAAARSAGY